MDDAARGGPDAFEGELLAALELVRDKLKPMFWSFHLRPQDAEDVLQKALLATVTALRNGTEIQNLAGWLFNTARYRCIVHARTLRKLDARDFPMEAIAFEEPYDEEYVGRLIWLLDAQEKLARLPPRHRLLLELRVAGYKNREIAEMTGYAWDSVRRTLCRLEKRLSQGMWGAIKKTDGRCFPRKKQSVDGS